MGANATRFISGPVPTISKTLGGGLNSTSGPLGLEDNESSDLQNIEFDKFGSILKRNGYTVLNTTPVNGGSGIPQGLYWYTNPISRQLVKVDNGRIFANYGLGTNFNDVTGAVSISTGGLDNNTMLLMHCDTITPSIIDQTGKTVTNNNVTLQSAVKVFGAGSLQFDGSTAYASLAVDTAWNFGSGDFTIDGWFMFNDLTGTQTLFSQPNAGGYSPIDLLKTVANKLALYVSSNGTSNDLFNGVLGSFVFQISTWYHIAVVRSGNSWNVYINGSSDISGTVAGTLYSSTGILRIGSDLASQYFFGRVDEFRISKGIARWTTTFTPPTSAYGSYQMQDFETFLTKLIGTDSDNVPWLYDGTNTCSSMTVLSGLTGSKFIKQFQNYTIMANVRISGAKYASRIMWSAIKTLDSWDGADFIDISKDDGDEITGLKVLGDRLVVYKNNSIYVVSFTGDADIPFIVQKTNSAVGCASHFSIQEWQNGHIFVSYDGIYFFDGNSSEKVSDRINDTFLTLTRADLINAVSMYQKNKNRYWLGSTTTTDNNIVLSWNTYLNSWSKYAGMSTSAMTIVKVDGVEERPYFTDYSGHAYRADFGNDDYPLNAKTPINNYYETNWKSYDDVCDKKGVPHVYVVYRTETTPTNLQLSWYYDFNTNSHNTRTISLLSKHGLTTSGYTERVDLSGRGRFVKIRLAEAGTGTAMRIDGLGAMVTLETLV